MYFNQDHPGFDLKYEVLAMLPKDIPVRHADLTADLEMATQRVLTSVFTLLRAEGFLVLSHNIPTPDGKRPGRGCRLARESWRKAQVKAQEYWDEVYGPTTKEGSIKEALRKAHQAGGYAWDAVEDPQRLMDEIRGA